MGLRCFFHTTFPCIKMQIWARFTFFTFDKWLILVNCDTSQARLMSSFDAYFDSSRNLPNLLQFIGVPEQQVMPGKHSAENPNTCGGGAQIIKCSITLTHQHYSTHTQHTPTRQHKGGTWQQHN